MTKILKFLAVGAFGALLATNGFAGMFASGVQFGVGLSATSGANGFVGYVNKNADSFWGKRLGVRLDVASTSPIKSKLSSTVDKAMGEEGIEVGDDLRIRNGGITAKHIAAMLDFYPFGNTWFLGGWRIIGGYYGGNFDVNADITAKDAAANEFELNHQLYRYDSGLLHGAARANWNYRGPYVGTGFDLGLLWGVKIYMDAGVVFTNKTARLNLDVPPEGLQEWNGTTWVAADESNLEANKAATLHDAQEEVDKITYFPIVKVGFMYRF